MRMENSVKHIVIAVWFVASSTILLAQADAQSAEELNNKSRDLSQLYSSEIELITIPTDRLPASCRIISDDESGPFLPSNPAAVTDSRLLGIVLSPFGPTDVSLYETIPKEIEAGFSAVYHDGDDRREIRVNLLLFNDEDEARQRYEAFCPMSGLIFLEGRHVLTFWSDGTPTGTEQEIANYFGERMESRQIKIDRDI